MIRIARFGPRLSRAGRRATCLSETPIRSAANVSGDELRARDDDRGPASAQLLGFAGAAPFVGGAAALLVGPEHISSALDVATIVKMETAYGASILSFLGAVHWGRVVHASSLGSPFPAEQSTKQLVWSVTPSLIGFSAVRPRRADEALRAREMTRLAAAFPPAQPARSCS